MAARPSGPGNPPTYDELFELLLRISPERLGKERKSLRKTLSAARESGVAEVLRIRGTARAALLIGESPVFYRKRPIRSCRIFLPPGDRAAERWVREALKRNRAALKGELALRLDARNRSLLPQLYRLGLHIRAAVLGGDPRGALGALHRRYGKLAWPAESGVEARPLESADEVEQVIRIVKAEFSRNPQFGWFVAAPEFLERERKSLHSLRRKQPSTSFVVVRSARPSRVLGFFGFEVEARGDGVGPSASMALTFSRAIQGKGLAKHAYRLMLERMLELGVRSFVGGTSQRPVLRLAKVMGRPLLAYEMMAGKPFFKQVHFKYE